jgi:hypothetical protein
MAKEQQDKFASKAKAAIERAGIDVPVGKMKTVTDWMTSVYTKAKVPELKNRQLDATPRELVNLAILWSFRFSNADARKLLLSPPKASDEIRKLVAVRREEVTWLADAYQAAATGFAKLEEVLMTGVSLKDVDLKVTLSQEHDGYRNPAVPRPLPLIGLIEDLRETEAFQEGDPDAVSKIVERYIDAGALKVAEKLLEQAMSESESHAGLWFQKARLLLSQAHRESNTAFRYQILAESNDPLSAAERHNEEMAAEHNGNAAEAQLRVFDVCLKALALLPNDQGFDDEIRKWSTDFGAARLLRRQILERVVSEAGLQTDPYRPYGDSHERVLARLNRLTRWAPETGMGYVVDEVKCARLSREPLFSEVTDAVVLRAYDELMEDYTVTYNRPQLRLQALNFLRFLAPGKYPGEVSKFVEDLRMITPDKACDFLGPFDGIPAVEEDRSWRAVMFEHLGSAMDQQAQRSLVAEFYGKWIAWIERLKRETVGSLYADGVRRCFEANDGVGAYRLACQGEEEGALDHAD